MLKDPNPFQLNQLYDNADIRKSCPFSIYLSAHHTLDKSAILQHIDFHYYPQQLIYSNLT